LLTPRFALPVALLCASALAAVTVAARQSAPVAASRQNPALIEDLVYANRILANQGVVDGFGHVSVRDDKNPSHFLMSSSMAPALVTTKDILEYDLEGAPIDAAGRAVYLERFIHAAIYRARPDVKAIVHSHSPAVIPFGVTGTILRPVFHMGAFLGEGAPIFEIRDAVSGPTDMLISDNKLGDALAHALGGHAVILLRGHGSTAVGNSIQQVVFRAFYTEVNAKLQAEAMAVGKVNFLTPEEAAKASKNLDTLAARPWELWKAQIGKIK
jgi:ribulose-5-phosphate 4-epimerase/fuculose-1-phosphate aldolase